MFQSLGQLFSALFAVAATVERVAVSVDNIAKVGQAHSAHLLKETMEDLGINDDDLKLYSEKETEAEAADKA